MAYDKVVDSAALDGALTGIANAIRAKTGGTAGLTLDGMAAAIASIAVGNGSGGGLAYDMGEFVLDADVKQLSADGGIPHALGETPGFVLVWTDDFADLSPDNVASQQVNVGYTIMLGLFGLPQRLSSAATNDLALHSNFVIASGDYRLGYAPPTSAAYGLQSITLPSDTKIPLIQTGSNNYYRAGVKYKYFVSRAWWNVGGAENAD
jgi:hypothetical protein